MREFLVGGYVRDKLLGVKSKDIDIAIEGTYDEMYQYLFDNHVVMFQERPEFNTIRAYDCDLGPVDYVACPDGIEADLSRRDFTINAMAIPKDDESKLVDLYDGKKDLEDRRIRCVLNAEDRFREDPIRIIRGIRFHVKYGFFVDVYTHVAMRELGYLLKEVHVERLRQELEKCFYLDTLRTIRWLHILELDEILFNDLVWLKPTTEER